MIRVMLVDIGNPRGELNEPIGIEMLAGALSRTYKNDIDIEQVSLQITDLEACIPQLLNSHVVGLSVNIGCMSDLSKILDILSDTSGRVIVLGGTIPTFASEEILSRYPHVICVIGEGEEAIVSIVGCTLNAPTSLRDLKQCLLVSDIPNLVFILRERLAKTRRKMVDLQRCTSPERAFLPEVVAREGIVRIEGSRGCPWGRCSFCSVSSKYGGTGWRHFKTSQVLSELETISQHGALSPYFTDEDFIGHDHVRALNIADAIIEAKADKRISRSMNFFFSTSVHTLFQCGDLSDIRRLFKLLRSAGLREVFLGIESGCRTQLRRYNKGVTVEQNKKVIQLLQDIGISVDFGFILFDPEMSLEDLAENLAFIHDMGINRRDARVTKSMRVLPYTPLSKRLKDQGLIGNQLNLDQMFYPYQFRDPAIAVVFEAFQQWEASVIDQIYDLQSKARGEAESLEARARYKSILSNFRYLDIQFLRCAIQAMNTKNMDASKLYETVIKERDFLRLRSMLILCLPQIGS
jgi:radical SAM superfamily enzyme YgiQ (UPF0313 family)